MNDITDLPTERFTEEQRQQAKRILHNAETEKTPSSFLVEDKSDSIARLNALLRYSPDIRCYAILQKKFFIQITEIRPSADGAFWHCVVFDEDKKGTALLLPKGGPLLLYIR